MQRSRRAFIAAALMPALAALAQPAGEARVKAKLVITLARYTQWPPATFSSTNEPFLMCLVHRSDALASAFSELAGQSVAGHPVKLFDHASGRLNSCHVLFIHESAEREVASLLGSVATAPVMTIGDSEGFAAQGGMIGLANINDAIRLDVNLRSLRTARLELSSQVLKLAYQVRE